MRTYPNIEPSNFRRGEYIGYASGIWDIRKVGEVWKAVHRHDTCKGAIFADTLTNMSDKLKEATS